MDTQLFPVAPNTRHVHCSTKTHKNQGNEEPQTENEYLGELIALGIRQSNSGDTKPVALYIDQFDELVCEEIYQERAIKGGFTFRQMQLSPTGGQCQYCKDEAIDLHHRYAD